MPGTEQAREHIAALLREQEQAKAKGDAETVKLIAAQLKHYRALAKVPARRAETR